jgi:hypothetical protein
MAGDANGRALDTPARSTKIVVRPRTSEAVGSTTQSSPSSGRVIPPAEAEVDHAFGDVAALSCRIRKVRRTRSRSLRVELPDVCGQPARAGRCAGRRPALLKVK